MYLEEDLMVTLESFHCLKSTDSYKHYSHLLQKSDLPNYPKWEGGWGTGQEKKKKKRTHLLNRFR